MKRRPYQIESQEKSYARWCNGVNRQLLSLPTGMGKTVVGATLAQNHKIEGRTLFLLHREELALQTERAFQRWNPGKSIGVEMADRRAATSDDVVVASVPTIGREGSKRLDAICGTVDTPFDLVLCDEAHHSVADTYKNIFRRLRLLDGTGSARQLGNGTGDLRTFPLLVGITATPNRGDGKALAEVYDEVVYQYSIRKAIEEGWLCPPRGKKISAQVDLDSVKTTAGDFATKALEQQINTPELNQLIVRAWIDNAWPRQTVAFCVDVQHAKDLALMFARHSIPAEAIWAGDPRREEKLEAHRRGEIKVLCNCGILVEGYDDWQIQCVIMARPTKSTLLFIQMLGRGLRLPEGIDNLVEALKAGMKLPKVDCLVMDVVGITRRHSLVTLSSLFGMNAQMDLQGKGVVQSVQAIEEIAEKRPNIDFSKLTDINNLNVFVEDVNLFELRVPDELRVATLLSWYKIADGVYSITLPKKEKLTVQIDLLGQYSVQGTVAGKQISHAGFDDLQTAIQFADLTLSTVGREYMAILRQQRQHDNMAAVQDPAGDPAMRYLGIANMLKGVPSLSKQAARAAVARRIQENMRTK